MAYVLTIEFATEADAEALFGKLQAEPAQRVPAAEITLPNGRRVGFDHYLDELRAKLGASHADDDLTRRRTRRNDGGDPE